VEDDVDLDVGSLEVVEPNAQSDLDDLRQWLCDPRSQSPFVNTYTNLEIHLHKAKMNYLLAKSFGACVIFIAKRNDPSSSKMQYGV